MKKKFIKVAGIIVLCMALVGYWGYNKYLSPAPEIEQQLNNQFGPEFFNPFDDEKVANNAKSADDLAKKVDIPTVEASTASTASTPVNEVIVAKQITLDDINNKYKPKFNYLESVALSRLDTLYSVAFQEYVEGRKACTLNRAELVQKYMQAGTMLEASMNNQFYTTLEGMQAELVANNLPTELVGVTKREYEKAKSDKRSQLMAKVLK